MDRDEIETATIKDFADAAITAVLFGLLYYIILKIIFLPVKLLLLFLRAIGLKGIVILVLVGYVCHVNWDKIKPYGAALIERIVMRIN